MEDGKKISQTRWAQFFFGLLLIAATIAGYQQVWGAGFIRGDDVSVTANPLLAAPDGWREIWLAFDKPSQYFPLVNSVFRLEHMLWGFDPAGYHWVNLSLHALNAVLLWRLLRLLRIPGAWLAAGLFALHPVQVESVAWVAQLKSVLMGFFFLLALWCWARFFKKDTRARVVYYLAAFLFFALALSAKATAVALPFALLLLLWLKKKPITLARWAQVAPFFLLAGAMVSFTVGWERFHQATLGPGWASGIGERGLSASRALWFYLWKLIWPNEFSPSHWSVSVTNPQDYLWVGVTLAAVVLIWILRRYTGRSVETAMLFFAATLAPVLGFILLWTVRDSFVADHHQYLACIGPLALLAAGIELTATRVGRWLAPVIGVALLLLLGWRTWQQGAIYANPETLRDNPPSAVAHDSPGVLPGVKGEEKTAHDREAPQVDLNAPEANNNPGAVPTGEGPDEEIAQLEKLLAISPQDAVLQQLLGDVLARRQRPQEALAHWQRSLEFQPNNAELQGTVGRALASAGQVEAGLTHLRRAAELAPQDAQTHYNYATGLSLLERCADAIPEFEEALRLQPDFPQARGNLALCYVRSDRLAEAAAEYERILQTKPDDGTVHKNLAILLRELGRDAEAEQHAQRALELGAGAPPNP